MNYDAEINRIAETIRHDKDIAQPWRNKAKARLEEAQAFIRMGKTTSNLKPEGRVELDAPTHDGGYSLNNCICTDGMPARKDCPVHGTA